MALGRWTIDFYRGQPERYGTDSGFRELGYLILAVTATDERDGRERVAMQRTAGLDVPGSTPRRSGSNPTLAHDGYRGGSYISSDGAIDPPRNVRAYSLAMQRAGVELRERTAFEGLRLRAGRLVGVEDLGRPDRHRAGPPDRWADPPRRGPDRRDRIAAGGARHQIAVTEPHPAFEVERQPMVFDLGRGLYWRLEEGGLLFGMSNPAEKPGIAREIDWPYLRRMQRRLERLVPAARGLGLRKAWCATIDFTPDHQPILGPAITPGGDEIRGVTVASPGGHGMMWGPAVARIAADLVMTGRTGLADVADLGLDRFDEQGRSRLAADPIALPFPLSADD